MTWRSAPIFATQMLQFAGIANYWKEEVWRETNELEQPAIENDKCWPQTIQIPLQDVGCGCQIIQ